MTTVSTLTDIRTGRHDHFDRIVLDFAGVPGITDQKYVPVLIADGSGEPIELDGNAFLRISLAPAAAHDDTGAPTYHGPSTFTTPDLTNVAAVAVIGDFEAVLTIGIGVEHKSLFTVSTLTGPDRVVIDLGH